MIRGEKGHGEGGFRRNRGMPRARKRLHTTNSLQALTAGSCHKEQTPTMLAGLVGVARLLCTMLSWRRSLETSSIKAALSCNKRLCWLSKDTPQCPAPQHNSAQQQHSVVFDVVKSMTQTCCKQNKHACIRHTRL